MVQRLVLALLAAALLLPAAANANFPGTNGPIAFSFEGDIWRMQPDGTGRVNITNSDSISENAPAVSPDGASIAFTGGGVWVMDADGSNARQLHSGNDGRPAWSPDGSKLVFLSAGSLWTMGADGSDLHPIVALTIGSNPTVAGFPSWSPDGARIAYNDSTNSESQIFTVTPTGTDRRQLTTGAGFNLQPDWSPDGSRIAYVSKGNCVPSGVTYCASQVHTMNPDGTGIIQLTFRGDEDSYLPSWAPDGTQIAFQSPDPNQFLPQLYTVPAGGGSLTNLTARRGEDRAPSWSRGTAVPVDATAPALQVAAPAADAQYSEGQSVLAGYSCGDEDGGSGVATCAGSVDGTAIADGAALPTTAEGTHTFSLTGTDAAGNSATETRTYEVLAGSTAEEVSGGETVTTDPGGTGATPDVPVQTSITVPGGVSGTIGIDLQATGGTPPSGYSFFGNQVVLSGPVATAASPYVVVFTVDASQLGGVAPADLQLFRNGTLVTGCTSPTAATPDPCVVSRAVGSTGDAIITARTSAFSTWNMGALRYDVGPFQGSMASPPAVNSAKAGSTISLSFSLNGNRGGDIFASGYPRIATYTCGGTVPGATAGSPLAGTLTNRGGGAYTYVWKTDKSTGCRQAVLRFRDGTQRTLLFQMR
jgi:hypothetical protein